MLPDSLPERRGLFARRCSLGNQPAHPPVSHGDRRSGDLRASQRLNEIGGYEHIPLMEDIALFNQIKRRGDVVVLGERVEISPRRWLRHGVWRTVLLMYALRLGYWIGVPPATLK